MYFYINSYFYNKYKIYIIINNNNKYDIIKKILS